MSRLGHKVLIFVSMAVALGYAITKFEAVYGFWFHGPETWSRLFRPLPNWGTGTELYGALIAAKWIGTRNMWYGGLLLAIFFFTLFFKRYKFIAFLMLEGVLIELLDLFWLANGKYRWGWSTPNTGSAMMTALVWAVALLACGLYLLKVKPYRDT